MLRNIFGSLSHSFKDLDNELPSVLFELVVSNEETVDAN